MEWKSAMTGYTHTHTCVCACTTRKTMGLLQNQPLAMLYCERLTCYMLHTPRCVLCVYMRATIGPLNTELTEWNEPHSLGREKWILFLTWRILYFYLQYRYIHFFAISPCRRCRHCRQSTIVCLMLDNTIIGIVATAKKKTKLFVIWPFHSNVCWLFSVKLFVHMIAIHRIFNILNTSCAHSYIYTCMYMYDCTLLCWAHMPIERRIDDNWFR